MGDIEQEYYEYITTYIESELTDNFGCSVDDADNALLSDYSYKTLDRIASNIQGVEENSDIKNYLYNEILLASQIGFVLNSATKRFSLESPENRAYVEKKNKSKNRLSLKDKVIAILLRLLNRNIAIIS